jgi:hypothetical protein
MSEYGDQYYIKKGRKYLPVEKWDGFPSDGVWVVKDGGKKSRLVLELDERFKSSSALRAIGLTMDKLIQISENIIMENRGKSINEISHEIALAILKEKFEV